jgi:penicillin-binding protein 1C
MPLKNRFLTPSPDSFTGNFFRRPLNWLNKHKYSAGTVSLLLVIYFFSIPHKLFRESTSTVLEDRNGLLLGAKIAPDGQWRFPPTREIPEKFRKSLICFEDRQFYRHPGFNPFSLGKQGI